MTGSAIVFYAAAVLTVVFAAVMVFHVLTIVSARFRVPVEPLSFCWAAAAVEAMATRCRRLVERVLTWANIGRATTLSGVNT